MIYPNRGAGAVDDTSVGRRFNGTEAMTTRILLPSGEVAEVKLTFRKRRVYWLVSLDAVGPYLPISSVNLSQEISMVAI